MFNFGLLAARLSGATREMPRLAPWIVPVGAGASWFFYPAVSDVYQGYLQEEADQEVAIRMAKEDAALLAAEKAAARKALEDAAAAHAAQQAQGEAEEASEEAPEGGEEE